MMKLQAAALHAAIAAQRQRHQESFSPSSGGTTAPPGNCLDFRMRFQRKWTGRITFYVTFIASDVEESFGIQMGIGHVLRRLPLLAHRCRRPHRRIRRRPLPPARPISRRHRRRPRGSTDIIATSTPISNILITSTTTTIRTFLPRPMVTVTTLTIHFPLGDIPTTRRRSLGSSSRCPGTFQIFSMSVSLSTMRATDQDLKPVHFAPGWCRTRRRSSRATT